MQLTNTITCNHTAIQTDLPYQLWDSYTSFSGSGVPLWLIRILHNKPRYLFVNYSQCYFNYLSPAFLIDSLGLVRFFTLSVCFIFFLIFFPRYRLPVISGLLLYPWVFIFELVSL